jgi:hypothetical protein
MKQLASPKTTLNTSKFKTFILNLTPGSEWFFGTWCCVVWYVFVEGASSISVCKNELGRKWRYSKTGNEAGNRPK